jgi:hypothetical protein
MYHVINKEVKSFNEYQEMIAHEIMEFIEPDLDRRLAMYREKSDIFEALLFPRGDLLEFIRIPVIPPSREEINLLQRLLRARGIYFDEEQLPVDMLDLYRSAGLIDYNNYRAWPTDLGLRIGKMLRCEF